MALVGLLAAVALAGRGAPGDTGPFAARMRESAAAAEALQGPLDGTWVLADHGGRTRYILQISDPSGTNPHLDAAWRASADATRAGPVDEIVRRGERLRLGFEDQALGGAVTVALHRRNAVTWTGLLAKNGRVSAETLRRQP